ncbi:MAG: MerR family transcriptional regulator [Mycobacteriales bacterium]
MELLTIGEFARRSRLSPKALRLYDELGLLPPARVDPFSGYRRYSPAQLRQARIVGLLRELDMPLARIGAVLAMEPAAAAEEVATFQAELERRAGRSRQAASYLIHLLTGRDLPVYEVQVRELPARGLLSVLRHVYADELGDFAGSTLTCLGEAAPGLCGIEGLPFLVYHGAVNADSDGPVEVCRPVPEPDGDGALPDLPGVVVRREPAHREAYVRLTRGESSEAVAVAVLDMVGRWLDEHGEEAAGHPRQVFFADMRTARDDEAAFDLAVPLKARQE